MHRGHRIDKNLKADRGQNSICMSRQQPKRAVPEGIPTSGAAANHTGQSVIVVEASPTRQHVLRRLLQKNFERIFACRTPAAAIEQLRAQDGARPTALLLGLEAAPQPYTDELLALLRSAGHEELAVLILTHNAEPATVEWAARRARSAILLWEDFTDCADCLGKLLAPSATAAPSEPAGEPIRVLLVDDSRTVRMNYQRLLHKQGYHVELAAGADEAFELAQRRHFDVAIIDYFMPGGNGDQLCRRLQSDPRTAHITPAILTGTYNDQVIQDCLKAGAVECMFKNEAQELLIARLAAMSRAVRARAAVEAERRRLSGILASVGDGVYGLSRDGRITFSNPAACRILGYDHGDPLIGQQVAQLLYDASETAPQDPAGLLQRACTGGETLLGWETQFRHQNGMAVPVECTVYPLNIDGRREGAVIAFRDISERHALEQELLWQANHDPLTKLYNRRYFERQLEDEVQRCRRGGTSALLYLDLDRFKYINDIAGHAAGDQLLIEISQQMRERLRESDLLARLGGDEFALILRNVSGPQVLQAAESFRELLGGYTFVYGGSPYRVYGSIGVALIDDKMPSAGEALANADIACHLAKNKGRNQTHVYEPGSDAKLAMNVDLGWSTRLQQALVGDRFVLHYQPIVPLLRDGVVEEKILRCEVLIRLADLGPTVIAPNAFLPTAERFGLMPQIDLWVVRRVIEQLAELARSGRRACLAVNLSGHTLGDERLVPEVKRLLREHGVDPRSLSFEITETNAITNLDAARRLISDLREHGCRFALDDFGSGFSSFHHLKHLPVDVVKIDGQFVRGMARDPADRAIVMSINDIAHSFGKCTVAEFVESREILELLRDCGVDYAQGYYISPPGPAEAMH